MSLGLRIKEKRKEKGLNQTQLAKKLNITSASLSKIENESSISRKNIENVSKILEISTDYLLFGKKEEKIKKEELEFLKIIRSDNDIKKAVETLISAKKKIMDSFLTMSHA